VITIILSFWGFLLLTVLVIAQQEPRTSGCDDPWFMQVVCSKCLAPHQIRKCLRHCLRFVLAHKFRFRAYLVLRGAYAGLRSPEFFLSHTLTRGPSWTWTHGFRTSLKWSVWVCGCVWNWGPLNGYSTGKMVKIHWSGDTPFSNEPTSFLRTNHVLGSKHENMGFDGGFWSSVPYWESSPQCRLGTFLYPSETIFIGMETPHHF
jgi:hypothetical protein